MEHVYRDKVWTLKGYAPHTKKNGEEVRLRVWESKCEACGAPIECRTPFDYGNSRAFGLRHCPEHKGL